MPELWENSATCVLEKLASTFPCALQSERERQGSGRRAFAGESPSAPILGEALFLRIREQEFEGFIWWSSTLAVRAWPP